MNANVIINDTYFHIIQLSHMQIIDAGCYYPQHLHP
jgi:hypothetical protein